MYNQIHKAWCVGEAMSSAAQAEARRALLHLQVLNAVGLGAAAAAEAGTTPMPEVAGPPAKKARTAALTP